MKIVKIVQQQSQSVTNYDSGKERENECVFMYPELGPKIWAKL
jgi:hypothetical protein